MSKETETTSYLLGKVDGQVELLVGLVRDLDKKHDATSGVLHGRINALERRVIIIATVLTILLNGLKMGGGALLEKIFP